MSLDRKLAAWVDAGVIDPTTRERIAAFEEAQRKPYALYALIVLGGGTIALGVVSVVASNWDVISGGVKLAGDLALAAGLAAAAAYCALRGRRHATEVLVTILYGFTLASLALVGQVYQLGTPTYQGLLVWSASTLPLLLLGHSRYLAALGTAGLWITHGFALEALFDRLDVRDTYVADVVGSLLFASPLVYLLASRLPWLRRERPEYARTLEALAWCALLLGGFALQFVWYERTRADEIMRPGLLVTALLAAGFAAALPRLYPELARGALHTLWAITGLAWVSLALGAGFVRGENEAIGALMQLAWLAAFARASLQLGHVRAFNALTAAIALRVLVVYFEVFGSLLDTGLGLITGGALTLLLAYLWRRKVRALAPPTQPTPGAGHAA